jgi:hypothetical protein
LLPKLRKIRAAGTVREWPAWVHEQNRRIAGRVCDQSSRAWLYGKLLVALLTQKLVQLGSAFSPGATISGHPPIRSPWREFQFALHQIQQTIAPRLKLQQVLTHWNEIAMALAERNRKRVPQLDRLLLS